MRLIDADAVANRLNKAIDVFEKNNIHLEAMGILYAKEIIESEIECPTVEITDYDTGYQDGLEDGLNDIRPQGEWIEEDTELGAVGIKYTWYKCNKCGWSSSLVIPKNFCPNCGADMRKESDNDN